MHSELYMPRDTPLIHSLHSGARERGGGGDLTHTQTISLQVPIYTVGGERVSRLV